MQTDKNKALFLDRDGVINVDTGYVSKKENFIFIDGVFETLKYFQDLGYLLIIVTNQSGIGRGYYTKEDFLNLTNYMLEKFKKMNIHVKKVFFCPHTPTEKCTCRKPKPKMILDAIKEFNIDAKNSIMVGDKLSDVEAGLNAGVGKLFLMGEEKGGFFENIKSLYELQKVIKNEDKK